MSNNNEIDEFLLVLGIPCDQCELVNCDGYCYLEPPHYYNQCERKGIY